MIGEVCVVAGEYEDGVVEPRFAAHFLKELADGHIRIADTFVDDDALLRILGFVFLGDDVGVMTAGGEDGCHEGFLHLRHLRGVVLQERFIPDGPHTVKVLVTAKACVCIVVLTSVVVLKTSSARECLESHRTALGSVEESRLITFCCKDGSNTTDMVHRSWGEEERLYEHRDAR